MSDKKIIRSKRLYSFGSLSVVKEDDDAADNNNDMPDISPIYPVDPGDKKKRNLVRKALTFEDDEEDGPAPFTPPPLPQGRQENAKETTTTTIMQRRGRQDEIITDPSWADIHHMNMNKEEVIREFRVRRAAEMTGAEKKARDTLDGLVKLGLEYQDQKSGIRLPNDPKKRLVIAIFTSAVSPDGMFKMIYKVSQPVKTQKMRLIRISEYRGAFQASSKSEVTPVPDRYVLGILDIADNSGFIKLDTFVTDEYAESQCLFEIRVIGREPPMIWSIAALKGTFNRELMPPASSGIEDIVVVLDQLPPMGTDIRIGPRFMGFNVIPNDK